MFVRARPLFGQSLQFVKDLIIVADKGDVHAGRVTGLDPLQYGEKFGSFVAGEQP
jgi:hypothetical protein